MPDRAAAPLRRYRLSLDWWAVLGALAAAILVVSHVLPPITW